MSELGQQIIDTVCRIALENPTTVYRPIVVTAPPEDGCKWATKNGGCKYVHGDKPGCLIGHALWELGIIDASIADYNNGKPIQELIHALRLDIDREEITWLREVQRLQDAGQNWSAAIHSVAA